MVEIGTKVERNLRDRFGSLRDLPRDEIRTLKSSFGNLKDIKLTRAALGVVTGTIDNVADFTIDQAEITRRWLEPVLPGT